ncbi:MAG: protein associating with small stress protein PASs1 [Micavibrio sp.]|nr:protein associating with small stress protein PASs1 [Micavibrio sp.]
MRFDIDRVDFDGLDFERFKSEYLEPENPVIIENTKCFDDQILTPEYLKEHYAKEEKRELGWFDADLVDDGAIIVPKLVSDILSDESMSVRESPMRVFMQPGGHVTLPHYDGNSLHGLNVQVRGVKKWIITSPKTPLPTMPFMYAAMVKRNFVYKSDKYDYTEFVTKPGDMLFLPRYWYHEVQSLDPVNMNINWVFTPKIPNLTSPLGQREAEIVRMRRDMPLINKAFFPDEFKKYGGQGKELIDVYAEKVSSSDVMCRLVKEVSGYPNFLMVARDLSARAKEFTKNNFNV